MLSVGNTLLIPTPPTNKKHLFIIIAIEKGSDVALLVNIISATIACDNTCYVTIGEHPFVTHESVINYGDSRITPIANLEYNLNNGFFEKLTPVTRKLLRKIQDGALVSPAIRLKHKNFLCLNI